MKGGLIPGWICGGLMKGGPRGGNAGWKGGLNGGLGPMPAPDLSGETFPFSASDLDTLHLLHSCLNWKLLLPQCTQSQSPGRGGTLGRGGPCMCGGPGGPKCGGGGP